MNLQLNFSPKLTTLSLARELISRLKRFAAPRYSTRSWHSISVSALSRAPSWASRMKDSAAPTWSAQMSWTMRLASFSSSSWAS